jgi:hypothetical protein
MTENQLEAYRLMHKALGKALDEIHNPGFNRVVGLDIVEHIEAVRKQAEQVAPEDF